MRSCTAFSLITLISLSTARPAVLHHKREVPQEHSHEKFITGTRTALNLNNPAGIADPIFGLLGNGAAAQGAGTITNLDCLHQATADQAFTNAKAAGDVEGMTNALVYAALERNTGAVGQASVLCTETAVNPEIAAISQHQDPASTGAAEGNKAITLALAQQLASVGADPLIALESGTFAPGQIGDPTGAGNTCDTLDDPVGCIFTQNLLVEDATPEEIAAAVSGVVAAPPAAEAPVAEAPAAGNDTAVVAPPAAEAPAGCPAVSTVTVEAPAATAADPVLACPAVTTITVDPPAATAAPAPVVEAPAAEITAAPEAPTPASGSNVQPFTGTLGGPAPAVESSAGDRPFSVNGNTFVNIGAALQRSCAIQNNACANAVNSGQLGGSVADCNQQEQACNAAA